MALVNKTIYYYLILFATLLINFSLIPLVFEVIDTKNSNNIPYSSIISIMLAILIYLFIVIERRYYIHIFFYLVGLISLSVLLFLKKKYSIKNS